MAGLLSWLKREEIKYRAFVPDEESPLIAIVAYSSRKGAIAKLQGVWDAEARSVLIGDISVEVKYRNRGIGSRVLEEAIRVAKKLGANEVCGNISLVDDVKRLCAFYTKRGFTVSECVDKGDNFVATIKLDL